MKVVSYEGSATVPSPLFESTPRVPVAPSLFNRWLAFTIDWLFSLPILLFLFIPILGSIFVGLAFPVYWMLRDIKGASPGKAILGLKVIAMDGRPASSRALISRNIVFWAPHFIHIIPYVGTVVWLIVIVPVELLESLLVATTNSRLGDRLAGTRVVRALD